MDTRFEGSISGPPPSRPPARCGGTAGWKPRYFSANATLAPGVTPSAALGSVGGWVSGSPSAVEAGFEVDAGGEWLAHHRVGGAEVDGDGERGDDDAFDGDGGPAVSPGLRAMM